MKNNTCLITLAALLLACALQAEITLAPLFRDGAVLQREKPIPVWGAADAGENITVIFAGNSTSTKAAANGAWRVELPALEASFDPRTLTIAGAKDRVVVKDVLVGEVWLASGQSNMAWEVAKTYDAKYEAIAANYPSVRQFATKRTVADTPATSVEGSWTAAAPETVGNFTAVGYFFAVDLHRALNVPVGIINSSWGGSRVEAWMSPESAATRKGPVYASIFERWEEVLKNHPAAMKKHEAAMAAWEKEKAAAEAAGKTFRKARPRVPRGGPGHHDTPCGLYNGMINPLAPYALRGAIWYQGESNASRAGEYRELFSAMITGWREKFGQGDFPFYWVQLANYRAGGVDKTEYAFLREAQTQTLELPNTGQAVIIDIGNVIDIHPRNKKDVGRRLALLALARDYAKTGLIDSGPVYAGAKREGSSMRVSFAPSESPLTSPLTSQPTGFELAGEDKVFYPAEAKIYKKTVVVSSKDVPEPVAVRYAWRNAPAAGLFNQEGLPATPFRSDDW